MWALGSFGFLWSTESKRTSAIGTGGTGAPLHLVVGQAQRLVGDVRFVVEGDERFGHAVKGADVVVVVLADQFCRSTFEALGPRDEVHQRRTRDVQHAREEALRGEVGAAVLKHLT